MIYESSLCLYMACLFSLLTTNFLLNFFFISEKYIYIPYLFFKHSLKYFSLYSSIIEMETSFNCLLLGDNEILLPISINKYNNNNNDRFIKFGQHIFNLKNLTVSLLRQQICETKGVSNFDNMKLWKLREVKYRDIKRQKIST